MRTPRVRKYSLPLVLLIILAELLFVMYSCGGGGGGGGGGPIGPPFIYAEIFSLPTGSSLSGYQSTSVYVLDDNTGYPITNAVVTINNVTLSYISAYESYEGDVIIAPGENVVLNVTVGGKTYTASGTQFSSYPTIVQPASGATWATSLPHTIKWSGNYPTNTSQGLGILDANDPNGQLLWPSEGYLRWVGSSDTSYVIPANDLTAGNRLAIVCIWKDIYMSDAAMGSVLSIGGFNYAPFTVTNASLVSITVTPVNPSIMKGLTQQFTATGIMSDGSTEDLTNLVTWQSSNENIAFMIYDSKGKALGYDIGSATITATYGNFSDSTTLTVNHGALISIAISPTNSGMPKGKTQQFTAMGTFVDTTTQDLTTSVMWTSSNTGVATISNTQGSNGQATPIAIGTTIITATLGGISDSTTLTVTNWTLQYSGTTSYLIGVAWSGTQFVAVGGNPDGWVETILTSPDGVTWTQQTSGSSCLLNSVIWSGAQFVAVGLDGSGYSIILTSLDGSTWTRQQSGTVSALAFNDIAWSGTKFVAVGAPMSYPPNVPILTSLDGVTWAAPDPGILSGLYGVTWAGTQFVAVGAGIFTSPDGVTWTKHSSSVDDRVVDITWSGTQCVAVGSAISTSPDGVTWTEQQNVGVWLYDIVWSGTQFIAVGDGILTSPDGITWTLQTISVPTLRSVAWSGTQFVAVGDGGTILTSP